MIVLVQIKKVLFNIISVAIRNNSTAIQPIAVSMQNNKALMQCTQNHYRLKCNTTKQKCTDANLKCSPTNIHFCIQCIENCIQNNNAFIQFFIVLPKKIAVLIQTTCAEIHNRFVWLQNDYVLRKPFFGLILKNPKTIANIELHCHSPPFKNDKYFNVECCLPFRA